MKEGNPLSLVFSLWKVVFKGPVVWTGKRPETGPNRTDLDRTAVAVAPPFRMDESLMCCCVSARANKNNSKHGCSGAQATVVLNQTQNGGNQHARCLWGRNTDTAN